MTIIFTELSTANAAKFSSVKPSGFMFEDTGLTLKVVSSPNCNSSNSSGNGTISDAIGTIVGAINEATTEDSRRLMLELEIIIKYFKHNSEISEFLESILMKLGDRDDWES